MNGAPVATLAATADVVAQGRQCNALLSPRVVVVEFHDTAHDRYFMTAAAGEQAAIDAGRAGPGWMRTGRTFGAFLDSNQCGPLATVFRFTNSPLRHVDLHFFTADVKECAIVRDTDWVDVRGHRVRGAETSHRRAAGSTKAL